MQNMHREKDRWKHKYHNECVRGGIVGDLLFPVSKIS